MFPTFEMMPDFVSGLYKHYKGGEYLCAGHITHDATSTHLQLLYVSMSTGQLWTRDISDWFSIIRYDIEGTVRRFTLIEPLTIDQMTNRLALLKADLIAKLPA